jgi:hypothetical protein
MSTSSTTNVNCFGGTTGAISITIAGGTTPYNYSWTGPSTYTSTNEDLTSLAYGTYNLTVTDAQGCTLTPPSFTLTQPNALTASITGTTHVTIFGQSTGSATVTPANGTAAYTFAWSDGQTVATAIGLAAGTYTVTVTDNCSATATASVTITQPPSISASITASTNIVCRGATTGAATVTAIGGTNTYTYVWTNAQTAATATGLAAGSYTVTVTDGNGASTTATVAITQPDALASSITGTTHVRINGLSTGSATVGASNGTSPYTYAWSTTPAQTGTTATGLIAGTYTVTVTDNCLATSVSSITVTQPAALTASITGTTHVRCHGATHGWATVTANGGENGYTYAWSTTPVQNATSASGLGAGSYTVTVTDGNGAVATASVTITQRPLLTASITGTTHVRINGQSTGGATVAAAGGTEPYSYRWTPSNQTTITATGLTATTYTVEVTDYYYCTATASVTLTQPEALVASISASTHITCNGASTGAATVSVTGGENGYTYAWSTSPTQQTSATATGLSAGAYSVTVTDGNGATSSASLTLTQPTLISASLTSNGPKHSAVAITLTATLSDGTQGSGPYYTYSWTKPNGTTSSAISSGSEALSAGVVTTTFTISSPTTYDNGIWTLTVTDANGCTQTASTTLVIYPYRIYVATAAAAPPGNNNNNGMITAPLLTIQKAIDVSVAGDTIEVLTGQFDESPVIDKSLRINGTGSSTLGSGKYFVYNTANTVTWGSSWTSTVFDNLGTKVSGAISAVHDKLNSNGTMWITGDLTVTSAITVSKAITIQGTKSDGTVESYSNCAIEPYSSITLSNGGSSADTVLFDFTGSTAKTVKDLELNIRQTGIYFRIPSGSSGNVSATTNINFFTDTDNNGSYETRLFGVTNGSFSGGNKYDVAKFVHDASDNGYGSGTVTYGNNGPLPWSDLVIGWKADDAGHNANGGRVKTLEPMKSTTKLQNLNLLSRRPQYFLPTIANNPFNSKSYMWFDGADEYLESNTTSDVNSGSQKSLFVVFQLDSGSITNTSDEVIYKHGDEDQGMSIVHTSNGDLTINVYEGATDATRESWLYKSTDLALNTVYVAQLYFNGTGGTDNENKRVGAALDKNSGRVTESNHGNQNGYVNNVAFTPSTLTTPATIDAASMISLGARSGSMYYATWDQITPVVLSGQSVTTEGRANFFGGTIAEVVMINSASESTRDAVYCYFRNKYLTSSGVGNTLDKPGDDAIAGEVGTFDPEIAVWPNPVQDDLTLELAVPSAGYVIVKLHDALGREVQTLFEGTVSSNTLLPVRADVRNIPSGAYLINVMGAGEMQLTAPVIVRH